MINDCTLDQELLKMAHSVVQGGLCSLGQMMGPRCII
jgi:hypothetical protein